MRNFSMYHSIKDIALNVGERWWLKVHPVYAENRKLSSSGDVHCHSNFRKYLCIDMFESFVMRRMKLETVNEAGKQARKNSIEWCENIIDIVRKTVFIKEVRDMKVIKSFSKSKLCCLIIWLIIDFASARILQPSIFTTRCSLPCFLNSMLEMSR